MLEQDPQTRFIVLGGESGGIQEQLAARLVATGIISKSVIAMVVGVTLTGPSAFAIAIAVALAGLVFEFVTRMSVPAALGGLLTTVVLGVSMLVDAINNRRPAGATENTAFGAPAAAQTTVWASRSGSIQTGTGCARPIGATPPIAKPVSARTRCASQRLSRSPVAASAASRSIRTAGETGSTFRARFMA